MEIVLVLNSDFSPLNLTSVRRGFNLVISGKAEILKFSELPILAGEKTYSKPQIIRLLSYVRFHDRSLKLNRQRILKRDNYRCSYCGSEKNLTIDHIIPKSRGGKNTWTNLVTSCLKCNNKKNNRTPEEANMVLSHKPYEPSVISEIINPKVSLIWEEFKNSFKF